MSTSTAPRKSAKSASASVAPVNRLFETDEQSVTTQRPSQAPVQIQPAKSRVSAGTIQAANEASLNEADILRLLAEYDRLNVEAKVIYSRKDEIEATLLEVLRPGDIIKMADGRSATIDDNFSGIDKKTGKTKNVSWKPCGVKRFEISITASKK